MVSGRPGFSLSGLETVPLTRGGIVAGSAFGGVSCSSISENGKNKTSVSQLVSMAFPVINQNVHTFYLNSCRGLCTSSMTTIASTVLGLELFNVELHGDAVLLHLILPTGSQWQVVLLPLCCHSRFGQLTAQRDCTAYFSLYIL